MAAVYYSIGAAATLFAFVMWLAALQNKTSLASRDAAEMNRRLEAHEKLCDALSANIERRHEESRQWMARLEDKIDVLMRKT